MIIGVIGYGFVGSALKATLEKSFQVETYDINPALSTTKSIQDLTEMAECVFVCVPTPPNPDGSADTSIVESVLAAIGKAECAVVLKSTVPPGFTEAESEKLGRGIIFNPEFLTAANAVADYANQNHTILGVADIGTINHHERLVTQVLKTALPLSVIIHTKSRTAELLKYARNAFLATKVSFANEIYALAEALNIPYSEVESLMILDKRIGPSHLSVPGWDGSLGFGGACFPKDTAALLAVLKTLQLPHKTLEGAIQTNQRVRRGWTSLTIGVTAGSFDLLHAGHIRMLEDAKNVCNYLIVLLQSDPTIDRPHKNAPVQSLEERRTQLAAVSYVDEIVTYDTEEDLYQELKKISPDIRIQGNDWEGKGYTGQDLDIPIHYHDRLSHTYSTSNLRKRIQESEYPKTSD